MLNKRQKQYLAYRLQDVIYHYAQVLGDYEVDKNTPLEILRLRCSEASLAVSNMIDLVQLLIGAEDKANYSHFVVFQYLGLDYNKDYIDYIDSMVAQIKQRYGKEEEKIPF